MLLGTVQVAQVFQIGTELLDALLVAANDPQSAISNISECLQSIAPIFVDRVGESNARIKNLSSDMLVKLSEHKASGFGPVCSALFKPIKSQTQWRPMLARLQVVVVHQHLAITESESSCDGAFFSFPPPWLNV